MIDGATNATSTGTTVGTGRDWEGNQWAVAVNPVTSKIYVTIDPLGARGSIAVIDGAANIPNDLKRTLLTSKP
jgi:DNA-binding beta-propeller fold protein YncE